MLQDYEKLPEQVDLRNPIYVKRTAARMPDIGKKVRAGMDDQEIQQKEQTWVWQ